MTPQLLVTTSHALLLVDLTSGTTRVVDRGRGLYYGLAAHEDHFFVAARRRMVSSDVPGSSEHGQILVFDAHLQQLGSLQPDFALRDMHEIAWHAGKLWVTCAFDDMVAILDGTTWRQWFPVGEPTGEPRDRHHLNSLFFEGDEVAVLAHGWGASTLHVFDARDLAPRRSIPLGVQAHNVWKEGGEYLACSSGEGCIVGDRGFRLQTGGFPRGVARVNGLRCVGISELAERTERDFTSGILQVYDATWQPGRTFVLAGQGLVLDLLPYRPASEPQPLDAKLRRMLRQAHGTDAEATTDATASRVAVVADAARPRPHVAVVLPAFDEELTVADTIRAFHEALPEASVHVVNNNSRDRTRERASATLRELGCAGSVIDEPRQGKGNALRRAFMDIDADVYLLADADLSYPARRARDLLQPILDKRADMTVGDRHSAGHYERENTRALHGFGNRLVRWLVNHLFHSCLNDVMSGYRAFSRVFVKNYPILVEGFQVETDMTLHALHNGFRIQEIPIEYRDRPEGSVSKLNTFSDGAKVLFTIAEILRYYRPMMFFGSLALAFAVAGLVAAIPVFEDWITARYIEHVPLAILASGLEVVAAMMLAIGLVLDSVTHQQRLEFERSMLAETAVQDDRRQR